MQDIVARRPRGVTDWPRTAPDVTRGYDDALPPRPGAKARDTGCGYKGALSVSSYPRVTRGHPTQTRMRSACCSTVKVIGVSPTMSPSA